MRTKKCCNCGLDKSLDEFSRCKRNKDGLMSRCKICNREIVKLNYYKNKDKTLKRVKIRSDVLRQTLYEIKSHYGCCICGEKESCCLDFHHIDPSIKDMTISQSHAYKNISKEIKKCVIVCSNCHRKIHAGTLIAPTGLVYELFEQYHEMCINKFDKVSVSSFIRNNKQIPICSCGKSMCKGSAMCFACSNIYRVREYKYTHPTKEQLEKLVWEKPTTQIAKEYGVVDNTISKLCTKYGVEKPPRGYWQKLKYGKL